MKAFNHRIRFPHDQQKPGATLAAEHANAPEVKVLFSPSGSNLKWSRVRSHWFEMAGRRTRHHADNHFEKCLAGCRWGVEIADVGIFSWQIGSSTIEVERGPLCTDERLRYWILHTILPFMWTLSERYEFIHAAGIEVEGASIAITAPSFGGKSTMAAMFVEKGHTFLSDDMLGIDRSSTPFCVVPSYPYYRPYRQPEDLGYRVEQFASGSRPLERFYLLEKSPADAPVEIQPIIGVEYFKSLHFARFVPFDFLKARHLHFLAEFAETIPGYRITVPWNLDRLNEVYTALVEHKR